MNKLQQAVLSIFLVASLNTVGAQSSRPSAKAYSHQARFSVYDYSTKAPIHHAIVLNGAGMELGYTNQDGDLALNLPPNPADSYTIMADGFDAMQIRLTQAEKRSGDYEVFLPSRDNSSGESAIASTRNELPIDTKPELVKIYVKQDPGTYVKQNDGEASIDFSVQVTASSKVISEKSARKEWEGLGPVYVQNENGMYKVRIGPYKSQLEAKTVLLEAKSKGRKDAFIVVRQGITHDAPVTSQANHAATTDAEPVATQEINNDMPKEEYKVRIASYLQPGGFNPEGVDQLGPLESYRKGEWTIMMIGGFQTLESARIARNVVISKGFSDAAIVKDNNGILETIEE